MLLVKSGVALLAALSLLALAPSGLAQTTSRGPSGTSPPGASTPVATANGPDAKAPAAQEKKDLAAPDMTIRAPGLTQQAEEEAVRQKIQPGNNSPVWREIRSGAGAYASVPGRETNVLVQNEGQEWRARRNGFWSIASGWLIVGVLALLAVAYVVLGTARLDHPETGRKILRFTQIERWVHWTVAISWIALATSGLIMLFGKNILLPVIGYSLFSALASLAKNLHNLLGPLFFVSLLVMIVTFIRHNFPHGYDFTYLFKLGGLFSKEHVPSGKFNAGEKLWFWGGVMGVGVVVSLSGLVLDFPNFDQTRATMQTANIIHLIGASLFIAFGMGHAYLGTLGVAGAYQAMKTGVVDEEWAREHHQHWYEDVKSGKVDAYVGEARPVLARPVSGAAD